MLKRFRVQNFKSILDVEVRLSPVTVLAGVSGSGKTNLLQSFDLLHYLITGEPASWFKGVTPNSAVFRPGGGAVNEAFKSRFDLSFEAPDSIGQFTYNLEVAFHHTAVEPVAELLKAAASDRPLFAWRNGKWSHKPAVDTANSRNHPSKLRWLTAIDEANIAYLTLGKGIAVYEFSNGVLTGGQSQRADGTLTRDGSNAAEVLRAIMENLNTLPRWRSIEETMKILAPSIVSMARSPHKNNELLLTTKFNDADIDLTLSQQSDGFRRALAHLLAIYQVTTPQMVIFEEPDDGISPNLLPLLMHHMQSASAAFGTQFLLTTHSPDLVKCMPVDAIRWVQMTEKGTQILSITEGELPSLLANLTGVDQPDPPTVAAPATNEAVD